MALPADSQLAKCQAPPEVKEVPLFSLTEESFKACHLTLTLDDYLFIAFVGFVVSIASVATNFLLGITANCCHRWSKAIEDEEGLPQNGGFSLWLVRPRNTVTATKTG